MKNDGLISELKSILNDENNFITDDIDLVIIYLKLGNVLHSYCKPNNANKDIILLSVFKELKTEFAKIHINNSKSVRCLYQLALDYNRLDFVKTLIKQISIDNKILIMNGVLSSSNIITDIKNCIKESYYIDKYTKKYYYNELEIIADDEQWSFRATMNLLNIFKDTKMLTA